MAWEWLKKWGQDTPRVHSFSPRSFEEAGEMATRIAEGDIVLLNVEHLEWEVARRVVDFLCGAAFVACYCCHRTGPYNYIFLPGGVEFSEELAQEAEKAPGGEPEEASHVPPERETPEPEPPAEAAGGPEDPGPSPEEKPEETPQPQTAPEEEPQDPKNP